MGEDILGGDHFSSTISFVLFISFRERFRDSNDNRSLDAIINFTITNNNKSFNTSDISILHFHVLAYLPSLPRRPRTRGDAAAPRFRHSATTGPQTPPRLAVAAAPPEGRGQRDRALPRRRRTPPRLAVVVAIALPENLAGEAWPRVVATVPPRDNRGGPAAPHHLHPPAGGPRGGPRVATSVASRASHGRARHAEGAAPLPLCRRRPGGSAATPCPRCRATRDPWRTPPPLAGDVVPPQVRGECGRVSPSPSGRARSAKDAAATPSCRRRFGGSTATPRPATPRRQRPRLAAAVRPRESRRSTREPRRTRSRLAGEAVRS